MLKWIREFRLDLKTTVVILVIALIGWAFVIYSNIRDFVPDELTEPAGETR